MRYAVMRRRPVLRGDLVDGPLAVVDVEQREDGEAARERAHGERIGSSARSGVWSIRPVARIALRSVDAAMVPLAMTRLVEPAEAVFTSELDCALDVRYPRCYRRYQRYCVCARGSATQIDRAAGRAHRAAPAACGAGGRSAHELRQVFTNLTNCGPVSVYVKDGVVTRIRPLVADEADFRPWTIEAGGKKYSPPKKFNLAPMVHAERRRLYSDERIKYPMKRVDFDPNGERNPQNRGKSAYVRISWDEALDIVSGEIKRVKDTYGGSADQRHDLLPPQLGHRRLQDGPVHALHEPASSPRPCSTTPTAGRAGTGAPRTPTASTGASACPSSSTMLEDALQNTEMIVFWSNDPDTTRGTYSGQESALWRHVAQGEGRQDGLHRPLPQLHQRARGRGKWIAPRMGTDTALAMAIAYVWITEDTYDKEYVADRTIGFDEFKPYVLGETDGVPKTPEWAAEECGVEARVIRALAREWAAKRTVLVGRRPRRRRRRLPQAYATEWARMMVLLQAMQGLGKPGVSIWGTAMGAPADYETWFPAYADRRAACPTPRWRRLHAGQNPTKQRLYRLTVPDAILDPPVELVRRRLLRPVARAAVRALRLSR